MSLVEFRNQLTKKLASVGLAEEKVRPFVCTGSPLSCDIMMVGYNPSRDMELATFDARIWDDNTGFHREHFVELYDFAGHQQGENRWIRNHIFQQNLIDELPDYAVLETYLYSMITPKKSLVPTLHRNTEIFDWLVKVVQPKLIITQNSEVRRHFERVTTKTLKRNEFNAVMYQAQPCVILPISHLSKKWTFAEIAALRESVLTFLEMLEDV